MAIQDKFADLAYDEPVKIEIERHELELDMDSDDIVPLMSMGGAQGEIGESDVEKLKEVFQRVLYRSYLPYWDEARDMEPKTSQRTVRKRMKKPRSSLMGF